MLFVARNGTNLSHLFLCVNSLEIASRPSLLTCSLFVIRFRTQWTRRQVLLHLGGNTLTSSLTSKRWCAVTRQETTLSSLRNVFSMRISLISRSLTRYVLSALHSLARVRAPLHMADGIL